MPIRLPNWASNNVKVLSSPTAFSLRLLIVHFILIAVWQISQILAGPWHLPLDDAYIHLAFSRNLAKAGVWGLNLGQPSTGATSLLWPIFLIPGWLLGQPEVWSWIVGAAWFLILGHLNLRFIRVVFCHESRGFWVCAFAAMTLHGHFFLLGLSGMESLAFLACGLGSLVFYAEERYLLSGCLAAGAILLRPEGILVVIVLGIWTAYLYSRQHNGVSRAMFLRVFALPLVALMLYVLVNYKISGDLLPGTYWGRKELTFQASQSIFSHLWLAIRFPLSWAHHLVYYALGAKMLEVIRLPQVFLFFWIALVSSGLLVGFILLGRYAWERRSTPEGGLLVFFLLWLVVHNVVYMVALPQRGNAGRYQPMNFIAASLAIILLCQAAQKSRLMRSKRRRIYALVGLTLAALFLNLLPHWMVQHCCAQRIEEVYVSTSRYLQSPSAPPGKVAVFDIGYLACFSGREIVDLGGLNHKDPLIWSDPRGYAISKGAKLRIYQGMDFDPSSSSDRAGDTILHVAFYSGPYRNVIQQALAGATSGMVVLEINVFAEPTRR